MLDTSGLECNSQGAEVPCGVGGGPLLHNTKSIHTERVTIDEKTGEIHRFRLNRKRGEYVLENDPESARFNRYRLQNVSRGVLADAETPRGGQYRVLKCVRTRLADDVRVFLSNEHKRAHYANLMICGSVWTCPVCAAKISERRKKEIEAAANVHTEAGGQLLMVTLTFSHDRFDKVADLLGSDQRSGLRGALQRFRNSRGYKSVAEEMGLLGLVRNLEVTWGAKNGWHPHVHELWLNKNRIGPLKLAALRNKLFDAWHSACVNAGLPAPNRKRGVHIVVAKSPAEYLQKWGREERWGVSSELSKSHIKTSSNPKGFTPFDLLRAIDENSPNSELYASIYRDYAKAFFGARQCFWTRGLKAAFGIADLSDEQLAELQDDGAKEVCSITADQWRLVIEQKSDVRATILRLAETGGSEAVFLFIDSLRMPPVTLQAVPVEEQVCISQADKDDLIVSWARSRPVFLDPLKLSPGRVLPLGQMSLFDSPLE